MGESLGWMFLGIGGILEIVYLVVLVKRLGRVAPTRPNHMLTSNDMLPGSRTEMLLLFGGIVIVIAGFYILVQFGRYSGR